MSRINQQSISSIGAQRLSRLKYSTALGMAFSFLAACAFLLLPSSAATVDAKSRDASGKGPLGQVLTVSPGRQVADGQELTVTGKNFDKDVGIYAAYCEIPKRGQKPEHCYGGININGSSKGSIWITNHKPFLVPSSVVRKFGKGGTFKVKVKVVRFIDETDCAVTKCGVITRADHTRSDFRLADVLVPITFKK